MIKCVASDLDGTIIGKNGMSDKTREAIARLKEAGICFISVSGRSKIGMKTFYEMLGGYCESIFFNGASYSDANGNIEKTILMEKELIASFLAYAKKHNLHWLMYDLDNIYTYDFKSFRELNNKAMMDYYGYDLKDDFYNSIKEIDDEELLKKDIIKCEIVDLDKEKIVREREGLSLLPSSFVTSAFPYNIEIYDHKAVKGVSLKEICHQKGYKDDEVMIFGDAINDLSMFENFENSCAMANGDEYIKSIAKYQCLSVDDDGFYHKIVEVLEKQ